MKIQFLKLKEGATMPVYQTTGAAAMDLHACLDQPVAIGPLERVVIPTGFAMHVPDGYEAQIRARSGLSMKHGIALANGVGTIDSDYRGEIGVSLINLSQDVFEVNPDMRIAQMVVAACEKVEWDVVETLEQTERGEGKYGSTGC